jgi:outer membrane autotransporter protein
MGAALFMASLRAAPALAACSPADTTSSPVTCTGTDTTGVTTTVNGRSVTVQPGATVDVSATPNSTAIQVNDTANVTNNGTIKGGDSGNGITGGDNGAYTNNGSISVTSSGNGIWVNNGNTVSNNGTISVGDGGVAINTSGDGNTITSTGLLIAGANGTGISQANGLGQTITNGGTIRVGDNGTGIEATVNTVVINNGKIVTGANGKSISSIGGGPLGDTITNNGTLDGTISIFNANSTLTNNGLITITNSGTAVGAQHQISAGGGGTFTQNAGGVLELRVDRTGASDTLIVDTANLGGTLRAVVQPGLYNTTTNYASLINACVCGLNGTFASTVASSPFFTVTPTYDNGTGQMDITLTRLGFGAAPGMTSNQQAVGAALEANYHGGVGLSTSATTLYSNLFGATSLSALDQLSGQGTAATQSAAFGLGGTFLNVMAQAPGFGPQGADIAPLGYASAEKRVHPAFAALARDETERRHWQAWAMGFGASRSLSGGGNTAATNQRGGGGAIGVSYMPDSNRTVGFAVGASGSHFDVPDLSTRGDLTAGHVGVYGQQRWGAVYANAALSYAHIANQTTRVITGIGPSETATGSFDSDMLSGRIEIGWTHVLDRFQVTPFAAVQFSQLWQRAYTESSTQIGGGAGVLGLSYASQSISSLPVSLGTQVDTSVALANGQTINPFARLAWVHEFKPDTRVSAAFVSIPGASFTVAGASAARDAAKIDTGVRIPISASAAFLVTANGEFGDGSRTYAGTGTLSVTW